MKNLKRHIIVNEKFVFPGRIEELKGVLYSSKDFTYEVLTEREIKIKSIVSWGTLQMNGQDLFDGIHVILSIENQDPDHLKTSIKTKLRPEHYFLTAIFILSLVAVALSDESTWLYLYIFCIWLISHIWFHFVYRLQERHLINEVVKALGLKRQ